MLDGNDWYYYDQNGNKCTGWVYVKNQWYLLNDAGVMQTGRQRVSGKWYYFYPGDGSKAVSTSIGGFVVDADGVWNH